MEKENNGNSQFKIFLKLISQLCRPLNQGFDNFYGVIGELFDYYHPQLVRDNSFMSDLEFSDDYFFTNVRLKA